MHSPTRQTPAARLTRRAIRPLFPLPEGQDWRGAPSPSQTAQLMDRTALRTVFTWPYLQRSLVVGAVVGTLLNVINQGYAVFGPVEFRWLNALLTYCVPFCVSTYGAYTGLASGIGENAPTPRP